MSRQALFVLVLLAGCAPQDAFRRVPLSGEVTYQGQPVEWGLIRFVPRAGGELPVTAAVVRNGTYRADARGGVPVGAYQIWIEAYVPGNVVGIDGTTEEKSDPPRAGAPGRQYLPREYNHESQLELDVTEDGPTEHDFHLK